MRKIRCFLLAALILVSMVVPVNADDFDAEVMEMFANYIEPSADVKLIGTSGLTVNGDGGWAFEESVTGAYNLTLALDDNGYQVLYKVPDLDELSVSVTKQVFNSKEPVTEFDADGVSCFNCAVNNGTYYYRGDLFSIPAVDDLMLAFIPKGAESVGDITYVCKVADIVNHVDETAETYSMDSVLVGSSIECTVAKDSKSFSLSYSLGSRSICGESVQEFAWRALGIPKRQKIDCNGACNGEVSFSAEYGSGDYIAYVQSESGVRYFVDVNIPDVKTQVSGGTPVYVNDAGQDASTLELTVDSHEAQTVKDVPVANSTQDAVIIIVACVLVVVAICVFSIFYKSNKGGK